MIPWTKEATLSEALAICGFTHRGREGSGRDVLDAAGEVVFSGIADEAWYWLHRREVATQTGDSFDHLNDFWELVDAGMGMRSACEAMLEIWNSPRSRKARAKKAERLTPS